MGFKILKLTCTILFINNIIVYAMGDVSVLDLIKSLKDTQDLLDAYNSGDYIKTLIKLIDIKLTVDAPPKGSSEEQALITTRQQLQTIYPYYLKLQNGIRNVPTIDELRNMKYEDVIDQLVNNLDGALYEIELRVDDLRNGGFLLPELQAKYEELIDLFNDVTEEIETAFLQAAGVRVEDGEVKFGAANAGIYLNRNTKESINTQA